MKIIQTVQVCHLVALYSKLNTTTLQYLANLVTNSLSIAQNMQERWDIIPSALKTMLDKFEVYVSGFSGVTLKILCVPLE